MNINSLTIPRPVREDRAVIGGMAELVGLDVCKKND
jgi:hypothetical protein